GRRAPTPPCRQSATDGAKEHGMSNELLEASTIWELVRRRAERSGDRVMLLDTAGRRMTFGELATEAERVAAGLLALGIEPGTTVTWQLPTRIDSVVVSI